MFPIASDRSVWLLVAGLALVDAVVLPAGGLSVRPWSLAVPVGGTLLLVAIAFVYRRLRPAPIIAAGATACAQLVAFTMVAAMLSYAALRLAPPLRDDWFAAADAALGFDWTAHVRFVARHALLGRVLQAAYFSCMLQLAVIVPALAVFDPAGLRHFVAAFCVTALAVILLAAPIPALGAYGVPRLGAADLALLPSPDAGRYHFADFLAVRAGTLRELDLARVEGVVQFPSFHAALTILFTAALARMRYAAVPALLLNGTMLVSTLSIGGHYLVDVLAGGVIALVVMALVWPQWRPASMVPRPRRAVRVAPAPVVLLDG